MSGAQEAFQKRLNKFFNETHELILKDNKFFQRYVRECKEQGRICKEDDPVVSSEYFFLGAFSCLHYLMQVDIDNENARKEGTSCIKSSCEILNDDEYNVVRACFDILNLKGDSRKKYYSLKDIDKKCPTIRVIKNNLIDLNYLEDIYNHFLFSQLSAFVMDFMDNQDVSVSVAEDACLWLQKSSDKNHKMLAYSGLSIMHFYSGSYGEAERCGKLGVDLFGPNIKYSPDDIIFLMWCECWRNVAVCRYFAKDFDFAESLFEKGAKLGISDCLVWLGDMYKYGEGEEVDFEQAKKYYQQAAEAGSEEGQASLSNFDVFVSWFAKRPIMVFEYENGHYEGEVFRGIPFGKGTYSFKNNSRYCGEFVWGHRTGTGTLSWPDGRRFEGEWRLDEGKGFLISPDGQRYERECKGDMIQDNKYSKDMSSIGLKEVPTTHFEAIDLGLPSGTKWASCNVGATKPEEYGDLFAWGETETKSIFSDRNYKFSHNIGNDIAGTKYDVAHMKWGGGWRMPTKAQMEELVEKCKVSQTSINGVKGVLVKGPNGRSIFLPAAGAQWITHGEEKYDEKGMYGEYWSSTYYPEDDCPFHLFASLPYGAYIGVSYRVPHAGMSIRPICM